ncbi:MAG TPA: NRDE family protein [Streptosporangiaceae bacterium]
MCLVIALSGVVPGAPLIVAANRDERYARPSVALAVLREHGPRVLGGQDQMAGGSWLAVNEHGVVAALTNQRLETPPDPAKRTRGDIPLAFTGYPTAAQAVQEVCASLVSSEYNPCWLLVGDSRELYSVDVTGGTRPRVTRLEPGMHVLENVPLGSDSAKAAQIAARVTAERAARANGGSGEAVQRSATGALATVLSQHDEAPGAAGRPDRSPACVHTADVGTRSTTIVTVPPVGPPILRVSDGPPCQAPLLAVAGLWEERRPAGLS